MGTGRSARVSRLLEQSATEQLRRRARGGRRSEQGWWTSWCSRWPSGYLGTRENGQVVQQREGMAHTELRERAYAGSIDRDLSLDTTNAEISTERCAVECRLDHVVHKQSSGLCCECNVQLGHESMEKVLSCLFFVELCKTCCVDARNVGNFVGHEICGGVNLDDGCIKTTNVGLNADAFTNDPKVLPRVLEETGTQSSCTGITRSDSEHSNVAGNGGTTTWDSRRVRRKAKEGTTESSSIVTSAASLVWV